MFLSLTLACAVSSAAQSKATAHSNSSDSHANGESALQGITLHGLVSGECPVSMHAVQGDGSGLMNVRRYQPDGNAPQPVVGQQIHLTTRNSKNAAMITGIQVTVYGTNGKGRMLPVGSTADALSNAVRTFALPIALERNESTSSDLVMRGFTSVQWIALDLVTYGDGSSWSPSAGKTCRVAPNPLVLIDATVKRPAE
jgi:hypothetical protein